MKTFVALICLAICIFVSADQKLRKIEILPSVLSSSNFESKIVEVSEEYIQKNLVGRPDLTFVDITDAISSEPLKLEINYPVPRRQDLVRPMLARANANSTRAFLTKLTSFPHRHSGRAGSQDSVLMIKAEIDNIINKLGEDRKRRFKVELIPIARYIANSIIVTFEGSGDDKDWFVAFGAHADDVGHPRAGADDNGSGTTAVMESFRLVAESTHNPSKSIVWFFYSAEEHGLVGSWQIARDWKARGVKVFGHVNFDMVGNHPAGQPLAGRRLTINTTPKITEYIFTLSKEYTKMNIDAWAFNGGSDHIPWTRSGYESTCLSEKVFSPHYHSARDVIGNVNFDLITEFARLATAWLVEAS
jgi:leucyl aminopeptidase